MNVLSYYKISCVQCWHFIPMVVREERKWSHSHYVFAICQTDFHIRSVLIESLARWGLQNNIGQGVAYERLLRQYTKWSGMPDRSVITVLNLSLCINQYEQVVRMSWTLATEMQEIERKQPVHSVSPVVGVEPNNNQNKQLWLIITNAC